MPKYDDLEKSVEKKYAGRDKKKQPKMHVSGKSVFSLKNLIKTANDRLSKRKSSKKKR